MKTLVLLLLIVAQFVIAQTVDTLSINEDQSVHIDSILITGNDLTEEFIILRELTISEGDEVTGKQLNYNRERVYSLGLFTYVDFYLLQKEEMKILNIDVFEKWYLYPLPFLYFNEGDFKNPTYGVNFRLENFRGRNETINAHLAFGYDPSYSLSYYNPALLFDNNIGFRIAVGYQDFANKSYNAEQIAGKEFEYTFYSTELSLSKRLNQFNFISISSGFKYIETDVPPTGKITGSGDKIDRIISLTVEYMYDSRDLKQFPQEGIFSSVKISRKGFGVDDVSYNSLKLDFRHYIHLLNNLTARWRAAYRTAFGREVPYYDYSYLGYGEYVRGHREDKKEGLQYLIGSLEMSYAIVKEWKLSLDLPLLPKSLTSARVGVNINIFTDAGATYDSFDELRLNSFYSGYGIGLNILFLPFNSIRFEYAFDEYKNGEFLVGLGFSF